MQIIIQPIVRALRLSEFAPEYGETAIQVWLNPPKSLTDERLALARRALATKTADEQSALAELERIGRETMDWLAKVWSAGAPETRWTAVEIGELVELDSGLYRWLLARTWQMIAEYRSGEKKI